MYPYSHKITLDELYIYKCDINLILWGWVNISIKLFNYMAIFFS